MFERMNGNYWRVLLVLGVSHLAVVFARAQNDGPGNAFIFDGTTGDHIMVNTFNDFPSSGITVEFWMRTSDQTKAGTPFSYAVTGEDNMLFIHDYRNFRFRLNGVAAPASGGTEVAANDGQWHHIAFVWYNNVPSGRLAFYVDGVLRYSLDDFQPGFVIPSGGALVIGQEQDSRGGGFEAAEAFLGTMDELRIWNVPRNVTSIGNDMHRSLVGNESGLVLYYRMDEATGNLTDSSGDGHTGVVSGAVRSSSTAPIGLPVVVNTLAANSISTTSARFRGNVDPNGFSSIGFFEYGTNTSQLTAETPYQTMAGFVDATSIDRNVTSLRPSTTYYFRAVGSNLLGKVRGTILNFTTLGPPSVIATPAINVTSDSATLTATVNPRGTSSVAYFEYGLTTNYNFITASTNIGAGTADISVSAAIADLTFDQTYNYRCVGSNVYGITYGPNRTFRTQVFGDIGAGLTGMMHSDAAWGDYDRDGDLDLVITGSTNGTVGAGLTQLVRNDGDGVFTPVASDLPPLTFGSVRWGDFDKDGWVDLVVMGYTPGGTNICQIRQNMGNGMFWDINAGLPGFARGSADWGDYDNDGDLDLLVTGSTNGTSFPSPARIYRNNGNRTFTDINAGLRALSDSAAAWGDYDNDGNLDFVLIGLGTNGISHTQIHRNNGNGTFTDINAGLIGLGLGAAAWGDYDNDGDLDLLLTGLTNTTGQGATTHLWRNLGNGSFAQASHTFPRLYGSAAAWGDFDNDGDLDLVLCGAQTNNVPLTELHRNNGNGTFTKLNASVPAVINGAVAWGDYDNDADLDLVLLGQDLFGGAAISHIRRNDSFPPNTVPDAPSGLVSSATVGNAVLSWNAASDAQTPSAALTYNVHVASVLESQADLINGYRRVAAMGNVQHGTNATLVLSNFPSGTYEWTVQAIDTAFAGGPFAPTNIIELPGRPSIFPMPAFNITTDGATLRAFISPGGRNTSASFDFGLTTAYGTQLGATNLGNGYSHIVVTADVGNLAPDTGYHFRATALNVFGPTTGQDVSFRTHFFSVHPPSVVLVLPPGAATNVSLTLSNHIATAVTVSNRFGLPPPYVLIVNPTFTLPANGTANLNLLFDSTDLAPDTYEATLRIESGPNHALVQVPIQLTVLAAEPADINSVSLQPNGSMLLDFIGTSGYTQTVLASTNLQDWTAIGPATQISPGRFQFTDPAATNFSQRFYKVRTP